MCFLHKSICSNNLFSYVEKIQHSYYITFLLATQFKNAIIGCFRFRIGYLQFGNIQIDVDRGVRPVLGQKNNGLDVPPASRLPLCVNRQLRLLVCCKNQLKPLVCCEFQLKPQICYGLSAVYCCKIQIKKSEHRRISQCSAKIIIFVY